MSYAEAEALKPCPFCGGEAEYDNSDHTAWEWFRCRGCGAQASGGRNYDDALQNWNSRSDDGAQARGYRRGLEEANDLVQEVGGLWLDHVEAPAARSIMQRMDYLLEQAPQAPTSWRRIPETVTEGVAPFIHQGAVLAYMRDGYEEVVMWTKLGGGSFIGSNGLTCDPVRWMPLHPPPTDLDDQ